jgi:hypothetical protein
MGSPRPKIGTPAMKLAAAQRVVADLVKGGHLEAREVEGAAEQIAKHGERWGDGYSLAKALDDREYWDCNLDMAETLDGFGSELDREIRAAQKAWFEAEKPEPPFAVGERIAFNSLGKQETGIIDAIYEHGVAQYTVKVDGDAEADGKSRRRLIIDWEAALAPEGIAA